MATRTPTHWPCSHIAHRKWTEHFPVFIDVSEHSFYLHLKHTICSNVAQALKMFIWDAFRPWQLIPAVCTFFVSIMKLEIEAKEEQMLEWETWYTGCLIPQRNSEILSLLRPADSYPSQCQVLNCSAEWVWGLCPPSREVEGKTSKGK